MRRVRCHPLLLAITALVLTAATGAQSLPGNGQAYHQVLIQKDEHGRVTSETAPQLPYVMEEIEEYGVLRVWIEANINYKPLEPTHPRFEMQQRRIRALLQGIVARLDRAMQDMGPDEEYPTLGPYVNVSANVEGARALVADRNVQAFFVLVPAY